MSSSIFLTTTSATLDEAGEEAEVENVSAKKQQMFSNDIELSLPSSTGETLTLTSTSIPIPKPKPKPKPKSTLISTTATTTTTISSDKKQLINDFDSNNNSNNNNLQTERIVGSIKAHQGKKCSISSSSSMLTNSSSSLTSIATSSPTSASFSNSSQHSMRSVSMSLNSSESGSMLPNHASTILADEDTSNSATALAARFEMIEVTRGPREEAEAVDARGLLAETDSVEDGTRQRQSQKVDHNEDKVDQQSDRFTVSQSSEIETETEACNKIGTESEILSADVVEHAVAGAGAAAAHVASSPTIGTLKNATQVYATEEAENAQDGAPCCANRTQIDETVYVDVGREEGEGDGEEDGEGEENVARHLVETATRLERSNSCTQADIAHSNALLDEAHSLATTVAASLSQENLPNNAIVDSVVELVKDKNNNSISGSTGQLSCQAPICVQTSNDESSQVFEAPILSGSSIEKQTIIDEVQPPQQAKQQQSTSSRFFSSKLNTGSLWSLLSVGSSQGAADEASDEIATATVKDINKQNSSREDIRTDSSANKHSSISFFSRVQFKRSAEQQHLIPSSMTTTTPSQLEQTTKVSSEAMTGIQRQEMQTKILHSNNASQFVEQRKRLRFNVKYIGSAILHKNFTLPMLEWIAKDIKRQTIKGAQSISQRQFTIPARDIILDIQSYQLMAISCRDGHCIFVHPMHCISKYVQLQFDQTCFSYLIRDTKDSPNFCHVFQAKSANKVHDIFTAIREVTTRGPQQVSAQSTDQLFAASSHNAVRKSASSDGQQHTKLKGFISDIGQAAAGVGATATATASGSSTNNDKLTKQLSLSIPSTPSILNNSSQQPSPLIQIPSFTNQENSTSTSTSTSTSSSSSSSSSSAGQTSQQVAFERLPSTSGSPASTAVSTPVVSSSSASPASLSTVSSACGGGHQSARSSSNLQFENSYQFEVMFVKKVKLQCRRVPASFVDDALETLKSFEVLKGGIESKCSQIKGVGKRIINASVDERQEYDEAAFQSPPGQKEFDNENQLKLPAGRESQSCHQTPSKLVDSSSRSLSSQGSSSSRRNNDCDDEQAIGNKQAESKKHHQSMDSLRNIDCTIKSAKTSDAPTYTNDFSPYNTITSIDLNERIAAIPVVSSSVSLDHETRQKLARQVRETIMATAANIKKDVYASGDKLDSSASSKALDSLSCTVSSLSQMNTCSNITSVGTTTISDNDYRRSSATCSSTVSSSQPSTLSANNFDLFRRASTRQVVKNRTMLLLIGKDELCTISIDKHQMLFSKSFNSIVHCLQGNNNRDHFGLICRDSGKINPNTESYAGFIFKCQSEKVVREIMGALKQVIYSSHHNYHGTNSPYNPLNLASQASKHSSQRYDLSGVGKSTSVDRDHALEAKTPAPRSSQNVSLAAKRGFSNTLELSESKEQGNSTLPNQQTSQASQDISLTSLTATHNSSATTFTKQTVNPISQITPPANSAQPKNLIKSMFCDNCPLYWFHRLCCDIESLPIEASKAIILRRIDSSMTDKEQDELYSKFSEFTIESIDEHNEIFMSLLRHLCERKQLKHSQLHSHISALAKASALIKQQNNNCGPQMAGSTVPGSSTLATSKINTNNPLTSSSRHSSVHSATPITMIKAALTQSPGTTETLTTTAATLSTASTTSKSSPSKQSSHQRSGSTSGSLAFVIGQTSANQASQSIADASSVAIDNLKKAKNSISVSIENMLKRRSSIRDEAAAAAGGAEEQQQLQIISGGILPTRAGSFKVNSREGRPSGQNYELGSESNNHINNNGNKNLKRSQSTSDHSNNDASNNNNQSAVLSWRDSLSRTINEADLGNNPLVGLFKRRGSTSGSKTALSGEQDGGENLDNSENSQGSPSNRLTGSPNSSSSSEPRFLYQQVAGGSSPSSMLSSAFWKKSIFDKIRQPLLAGDDNEAAVVAENIEASKREEEIARDDLHKQLEEEKRQQKQQKAIKDDISKGNVKRTSEELRSLWRKAIVEQITLLKMDKQNQRLQANTVECNIQRVKLNYRDVIHGREVLTLWEKLLKQDPRQKVEFVEVARLVGLGVPKQRRGEVWMFLMNQYQLRHGTSFQPADSEYRGDANQPYRSLLSQLSTQQHEIFVDIGRTFPTHPYYSQYLSIGQLSLFNLLKAYSLLDQEVGYCQGLSFVAGILLLHVESEDEAFELMRHLLFNFGLRKQYLPSMNALHLQLYQITRLLRDHEYELFNHFDHYDISPSLYAAPWFLTLFASQFPLGFVARLLDLIFLIGIEAIFRVSLNLLAHHRNSILDCTSLESTMHFMKNNLVNIGDKNLVNIFDKSLSLDLRNKLIEYEIEYTFYCAEDRARSGQVSSGQPPAQKPSLLKPGNTLRSEDKNNQDADKQSNGPEENVESTSKVADATATIIIQHLLATNHLRSLRSNYSY